jgi:YVTN family beta-propeller protein
MIRSMLSVILFFGFSTLALSAENTYHLAHKVILPGEAKWDYLNFDSVNQRLYLAQGNQVDVLSPAGKVLAVIPAAGSHGACPVPDSGFGYLSNGATNNVSIFDLKSSKVTSQVAAGQKPDAVGYDAVSNSIYICNGESSDATVIDVATGKVVATIPLGGSPEFLAADGHGNVLINLEDKDAIAVVDVRARKLVKTWALPKGSSPSSMAYDKANGKLFVGCRNKTLAVVDTRSGLVVQTLPIGAHVDATVYDSATGNIFSSCGEGIISIVHQDGPSAYSSAGTIKTLPGAHTLGLDPDTHELYVPASEAKVLTLLIFAP